MLNLTIHSEKTFFAKIHKNLTDFAIDCEHQCLEGFDSSNWLREITSFPISKKFCVFIFPIEWLLKLNLKQINDSFLVKMNSGIIKIVFLSIEKPQLEIIEKFNLFPYTIITESCERNILKNLYYEFFRGAQSGVLSLMSGPSKEVFSERLSSEKQFGTKIDQILQFFEKQNTPLSIESSFQIRLSISALLTSVFKDITQNSIQPKVVHLQMSSDDTLLVFSSKWKTKNFKLAMEGAWEIVFNNSHYLNLRFIPEAGEIECVVAFVKSGQNISCVAMGRDYVTNLKGKILSNTISSTEIEQSNFKTLSNLPSLDPVGEKTFSVIEGSGLSKRHVYIPVENQQVQKVKTEKAKDSPFSEVHCLKSQNIKLIDMNKKFKEKIADLTVRLGKTIEEKNKISALYRVLLDKTQTADASSEAHNE